MTEPSPATMSLARAQPAVSSSSSSSVSVRGGKANDHPVLKEAIMNLQPEDFTDCRKVRLNGKLYLSLIDCVVHLWKLCKITIDNGRAGNMLRTCKAVSEFFTNCLKHQFEGERQRETPIVTFVELLPIVAQLPGAPAKELRRQMAHIIARFAAGDASMADAAAAQAARVSDGQREAMMSGLEHKEASESAKRLVDDKREEQGLPPLTPKLLVSGDIAPGQYNLSWDKYIDLVDKYQAIKEREFKRDQEAKDAEFKRDEAAKDAESKRTIEMLKVTTDCKVREMQAKAQLEQRSPKRRKGRVTLFDQHGNRKIYIAAVDAALKGRMEGMCPCCNKSVISVANHFVQMRPGWKPGEDAPTADDVLICCKTCVPDHYETRHKHMKASRLVAWLMHCDFSVTGVCFACKSTGDPLHVLDMFDLAHDIAHSLGGTTHPDNVRPSHSHCNQRMGTARFPGDDSNHQPAMSRALAERVATHLRGNMKTSRPVNIMGPLPTGQPVLPYPSNEGQRFEAPMAFAH